MNEVNPPTLYSSSIEQKRQKVKSHQLRINEREHEKFVTFPPMKSAERGALSHILSSKLARGTLTRDGRNIQYIIKAIPKLECFTMQFQLEGSSRGWEVQTPPDKVLSRLLHHWKSKDSYAYNIKRFCNWLLG
jgi:hypothetical protein